MEEASTSRVLPGAQEGAASRLVARIIDLMATFRFYGYGASLDDPALLSKICFSLTKAIDHAIANNEVPLRSRDLPPLLNQVLVYTEDVSLRAALLRLIMCIDGACSLHWFSDQDSDNLLWLAKELFKIFSATTHIRFSPSVPSSMEKVMSRFYPQMKMDQMLISLELKPGLGGYAAHFHIIRGMIDPKQDKIWLFVARIDNMDTSSCIITPPEVNFLLNGKEVEGRNLGSMDKAPQLPTNVTHMIKYGVNMLQVVGEFPVPCKDPQELQECVSPAALTNSEAAIKETPSIVSLNCPISRARMKTPVKGQLCKHPQCFDYDNFLEINSKRPSWQCPQCKQSVCYLDLRIDRTVLKVLMEAEEKVLDVILSSDGSWKKIEDHCGKMHRKNQINQQECPRNHECLSTSAGRDTFFSLSSTGIHQIETQTASLANANASVVVRGPAPVQQVQRDTTIEDLALFI